MKYTVKDCALRHGGKEYRPGDTVDIDGAPSEGVAPFLDPAEATGASKENKPAGKRGKAVKPAGSRSQ